jgi:hypothetical protein
MKPISSIRSASSRTIVSIPVEFDDPLVHEVEEASRGGDEDVDTATHGGHLGTLVDATEDDGVGDAAPLHEGADDIGDLAGKLPGRGEDECPRLLRYRATRGGAVSPHEPMENRQNEGGGLAAARLGGGENVPAFDRRSNRIPLDRGRCDEALVAERLGEGRSKLKRGETHDIPCGFPARAGRCTACTQTPEPLVLPL